MEKAEFNAAYRSIFSDRKKPIVNYSALQILRVAALFHLKYTHTDTFEFCATSETINAVKYTDSVDNVSDEANVLADIIISHFKNKFLLKILASDNKLTDWQQAVYTILNENTAIDINSLDEDTDRDLALLASLPLFYDEDIVYNKIAKAYPELISNTESLSKIDNSNLAHCTLTFVEEIKSHRKSSRHSCFVFKHGNTNKLVHVIIKYNKQMRDLFISCIRNNKIVISGDTTTSQINRELESNIITNWTIHHDEY